jgi:hypothetical protein
VPFAGAVSILQRIQPIEAEIGSDIASMDSSVDLVTGPTLDDKAVFGRITVSSQNLSSAARFVLRIR